MFSHLLFVLYVVSFTSNFFNFVYGDMDDIKVLTVGKELWKETLPFQMGSRFYQLQGLKSYNWYEVKISYPASIPASFSIQLKKEDLDMGMNWNRRLLNTEKLIFKTDNLTSEQRNFHVLVTVEPEGIVALPQVPERQYIMFNIVCDELLMGIPHKAWLVVILVLACLGLAFSVPRFLAPYMTLRNKISNQTTSKES
ncbi:uncharacterized protein [Euphorbia lathyris]|uniref:uncharacterized protein n=1 Tax=Euphorbia lathyris TaxID=212925 RepID=UPI003313111D